MQTNEFTFYELTIHTGGQNRSLYTFQKPDADSGQMSVAEHTGILPQGMSIRQQGAKRLLCDELSLAGTETFITKIVNRNGDAILLTEDGREVRAHLPYAEFQRQFVRKAEECLPGSGTGSIFWTRDSLQAGEKELVMQNPDEEERVIANLSRAYEAYTGGTPISEILNSMKGDGKIRPGSTSGEEPCTQTYRGNLPAWEELRKTLYIDTVCVTKNKELLRKVPCIVKGDFAAVLVRGTQDGFTKPLTKDHLDLLGLDEKYVFAKAIENTEQRFPIPKYFFSVYQVEVIDGTGDPYDTKYRKNQFYRKVRIIQDLQAQHGHAVLFYPEFNETLKKSSGTAMYIIQDRDSYIAVPRELEINGYESAREWCDEFVEENNTSPSSPLSPFVHEFDPVERILLCNGKEKVDPEEKKPEKRNFRTGR